MAYRIKGGASCAWGIGGETSDMGTIIDVSIADAAQTENCEDQEGAVDGVVIYDVETTVKMTVVASAAGVPPTIGDTLTVGSVAGIVLNVEEGRQNKGKKKFTVSASTWENLDLSPVTPPGD